MPSLPNREILRAILSNPTAVRAERHRRRVRLGTDRDLLAFVEETFGVHIPAVACCPEHVAPAQAFCDAYFNRADVAVWKASRGFGGKSTLLALLALIEAITLQADVTVLGGSAQQSERVLEVMTRLWQAPHAPSHLLASPPAVRRTRFVWGNTITALPASQTAVRGPHPQRLRIDEADEMPLAVLDAAHGQPMDRAGVQAQTVISSTHQHPDGTMTAVLQRAAARDWPVYQWCYRDTLEPHGWLTQAQVDRKRAEVPEQTWLSEYDLQEPSAEGRAIDSKAVDWMFDPQRGTGGAAQLDQGWEGEAPADAAEAYYAHGADWGQAVDYTVIATLRCDVRPLPLVAAYRSHRRPWPVMIGCPERPHGPLSGRRGARPYRRRPRGRRIRDRPHPRCRHGGATPPRSLHRLLRGHRAPRDHGPTRGTLLQRASVLPRRRCLRLWPSPRHRRRHGARVPRLP